MVNKLRQVISGIRERHEAKRLAKASEGKKLSYNMQEAIRRSGIKGVVQELEANLHLSPRDRNVTLTLGENKRTYLGLTAEKLRYGKLRKIFLASNLRAKVYAESIKWIDKNIANKIYFQNGIKTRRSFLETIIASLSNPNVEHFWTDSFKNVGIIANPSGKLTIKKYDQKSIRDKQPEVDETFNIQLNADDVRNFSAYSQYTSDWHREMKEYHEGIWEIK